MLVLLFRIYRPGGNREQFYSEFDRPSGAKKKGNVDIHPRRAGSRLAQIENRRIYGHFLGCSSHAAARNLQQAGTLC